MNENTTTEGEKMDERQITAVIAKYAAKRDAQSRHLHHHFVGSGPYVTIELLAVAESLADRNAELERWKSEVSSVLSGIGLQAAPSPPKEARDA